MNKEVIPNRQAGAVMTMFLMGSTLILGVGSRAGQDVWLVILLAGAAAAPFLAIYARILALFPGQNLYQILITLFGPVAGRVLSLFYIWYAFSLGALVMRNFQEFINIVSFPETPIFVPIMMMGLVCIWAVKEGIEVLGRWSQLMFIFLAFIMIVVIALSVEDANIDNMRPVAYSGFRAIIRSAFNVFSFPMAETVLFMTVLRMDRERNNPYYIYFMGVLIGLIFILAASIRNLLVLGAELTENVYFPPYVAVTIINIGNFLQRIEITVSVVFLFTGFIKISICLMSACLGIDNLLGLGGYRQIVAPVGLLLMVTTCFLFRNIMEMSDFAFNLYRFYALPFQVALPVVIWIAAEVRVRRAMNES
jgi:spore germination protein KB